eukprot:1159602-Pelagomonas_calceolata.AAC.1
MQCLSSRPYTRGSLIQYQGSGAGPAPHHTSKLHSSNLSTRGAQHTIIRTKIKESHCTWNDANPLAQLQAGMVRRWIATSLTGQPPGPGPSKGIQKSMLMKFMSSGAVPGAWGGRAGKVKDNTFGIFASNLCPLHRKPSKLGFPNKKVLLGVHA